MFAARDQENLVHAHQTTAAGKPLNQGIRALHPKTPGATKTPFRRAPNDENKPLTLKGQKTGLRDGPSKLEKNAFATPAPNRAPLGFKTTNAKGNAFKTPAPQQSTKLDKTVKKPSTARRSAKKITVAPSEPVQNDVLAQLEEDSEPEYGYAPPPVVELPDPPMDLGYNDDFPQFQGKNFFAGYGEIYCTSPTDEHGVSLRKKAEEERRKQGMAEWEKEASVPPPVSALSTEAELGAEVDAMIAAGPKRSNIDTVKARSAAAALSKPSSRVPSVALKGTKASEQKRKPFSTVTDSAATTIRRAPPAVSRGTIGFPKARAAPSIIPKADQMRQKKVQKPKIDQSKIHPKEFVRLYGQPPQESNMWFRLKEYELLEEGQGDELADELFDTDFFPSTTDGLGDEEDVFQLPMPED